VQAVVAAHCKATGAVEGAECSRGGDDSKCSDAGSDCCANDERNEPADCADGYTPSNQPSSYDDCPNFTCHPPGDQVRRTPSCL
jgi:hypothetical protein